MIASTRRHRKVPRNEFVPPETGSQAAERLLLTRPAYDRAADGKAPETPIFPTMSTVSRLAVWSWPKAAEARCVNLDRIIDPDSEGCIVTTRCLLARHRSLTRMPFVTFGYRYTYVSRFLRNILPRVADFSLIPRLPRGASRDQGCLNIRGGGHRLARPLRAPALGQRLSQTRQVAICSNERSLTQIVP